VKPGENYLEPAGDASRITGNNNLWFGAGKGPARTAANVNADPRFVDPAKFDFHLQASSPAIDSGTNTAIRSDFDGIARPQGAGYDCGAFERPPQVTSRQQP